MIFIGLDISKISTAMCIEREGIIKLYSYTSKKENNIWVKDTKHLINYRYITYKYSEEKDYSKSEILKLNEFDVVTDMIISDIVDNIQNLDDIKIGIEGFSYNSKGPIFDLIEYTTFLKYKLMHQLNNIEINLISPLTLKSGACKMVYKPRIEIKGVRVIKEILHYENTKGKEATKFDKWDMFFAFIDSNITMDLKEWCEKYEQNITKNKEVPKPLDDIIDAIFIKEMIKKI